MRLAHYCSIAWAPAFLIRDLSTRDSAAFATPVICANASAAPCAQPTTLARLLRRCVAVGRRVEVTAVTATAIAAGLLLGYAGWLEPHRPIEFAALILIAILLSVFGAQPSPAEDRATMPPSFVIEFTSLLLSGWSDSTRAGAGTTACNCRPERPLRPANLVSMVTVLLQRSGCLAPRMLVGSTQLHMAVAGVPIARRDWYCVFQSSSVEYRAAPLEARFPARLASAYAAV